MGQAGRLRGQPDRLPLVAGFCGLLTFGCGEGVSETNARRREASEDSGPSTGVADSDTARPDALRPQPRVDTGSPPLDGDAEVAPGRDDGAGPPDARPAADARTPPDAQGAADAGPSPCAPQGTFACPVVVDRVPFVDRRDTSSPVDAPSDTADAYACRPETRETGPEVVYRVHVTERALLSARLEAPPEGGPDIDLHLLDAPRPEACLARDNLSLSRMLDPGDYFLVADTWADADAVEYPGPYMLTIDLSALGDDLCALQDLDLEMVWRSCAPGVDCYEGPDAEGVLRRFLRTPTTGPVVREAHLVTVADDFGGGWPGSFTDQIEAHYASSQAESGYEMDRREPWAPAGEGGSEYGQGSYGRPLPVLDEAWYVNMYWRHAPSPGTRILLRNPETGRAVVAAGGYETGPGDPAHIGGVTEEIHHHLGTVHQSVLLLGFLVDQTLPLGPIDCP